MVGVFGLRVGIYKIIAERLTKNPKTYTLFKKLLGNSKFGTKTENELQFLDKRLIDRGYPFKGGLYKYKLSLSMIPKFSRSMTQFNSGGPSTRYILLVPRIIEDGRSNHLANTLIKCQILFGLLMSISLFVLLRFYCNILFMEQINSGFLVHTFFDTFARALGIGPGTWFGRSTAERLLLTVIAVFAILAGSIVLGILYEKLVTEVSLKFGLNNLMEICQADMVLHIPSELAMLLVAKRYGEWSLDLP